VSEALELIRGLERRGLPMERIVVNMVDSAPLPERIAEIVDGRGGGGAAPWLTPAAVAISKRRTQEEAISRLASGSRLELLELPAVKGRSLDEAGVALLSRELERQLGQSGRGVVEG